MSEESKWKAMAEQNTILRVLVGSQLYGTSLDGGSSDRDEKGVCIEPLEGAMGFSVFEQYEFRSAAVRDGVNDAKSQAGDLDLVIYSLKKFLRLAMGGNPSVLELLFVKVDNCIAMNALGSKLQELAPQIISKKAGKGFLGYMESQRQKLVGEIGQKRVNRVELEEKYGYDTKYAMHIIRLGIQGVELMSSGKMSLPLQEKDREFCLAIRKGAVPIQEVLTRAGELERELKDLLSDGPLPVDANREFIEDWMLGVYWNMWKSQRFHLDRIPLGVM